MLVQTAREGDIAAEHIAQHLLIKPLDGRQDCQLKFKILGQETLPRAGIPPSVKGFFTAV